jgi:LuxR family maltose regulon positive regulatory protein
MCSHRATVSAPSQAGAPLAELLLRATAPRAPRNLLLRPRLGSEDAQFKDRPLVLVQAPAGFGKTSLLAQWRREHLSRGAAVAWLSAGTGDDARRFVQGLALAVRLASGRQEFGRTILDGPGPADELDAATAWLAELAQSALDVVLMLDDAERMAPDTLHGVVSYLVHNQPSNLRVVLAARGEIDLDVTDLVAYGDCATVGAEALRFTLAETISTARQRFGARIDTDDCARLHEATEGWPLGLQLALSSMEASADPRAAVKALSAPSGRTPARLLTGLLANLAPQDSEFLTRVSGVDLLHPGLCEAITGDKAAGERLARLARDTPILIATEEGEWLRMHTLARDALRAGFAALPADERGPMQSRAARWLADRGLVEEAARHAYEAGQHELAFDLAEQCLYEAMMHGRHSSVLEWLNRLPEPELDRRPRLRLAAGWALALTQRNEEAGRQVERILAGPAVDQALRYECALILSGAAYFADEPDKFNTLFEPWAAAPPADAALARMHANRLAVRALLAGEPAEARRHQQAAPKDEGAGGSIPFLARWGDFITGLAYIWEGQVRLAEEWLRPVAADAEGRMGRRAPLACMLATLLAAAKWERNQPDEAAALLANRLDVLERAGVPETVLLAYRTLARIAAFTGDEHRALDMLESLRAAGAERRLPRLEVASLADQVRTHARRFRPETCRALCRQIDEVLARKDLPQGPIWQRSVQVLRSLAQGYAAIAGQDWREAIPALERAGELAGAAKQGRLRLETMALRAFAVDREGGDGASLVREAANLAETYGLARLFEDAHPAVGDWARRVIEPEGEHAIPAVAPPRPAGPAAPMRAVPTMLLTPKEREVLELLARNLSNKEIAAAMGVGEETVKWHLKNLFGKLSAGSRKHVVRRAQLLGLLETSG